MTGATMGSYRSGRWGGGVRELTVAGSRGLAIR
jgi:hypothetical protein